MQALAAAVVLALGGCSSGGGSDSEVPPLGNNRAPAISGEPPASTKVGEAWSFSPTASDADGDPLTFTIENQPAWTDFNEATGALHGEPQAGDEGDYADVTITVTDGMATDSLVFSVFVNQVSTGSVTVSWVAPTLNDDGSPLTDLAAYKIYHGRSWGNYSEEILIENSGITTFVVENLTSGRYYFVATALNSEGIESDESSVLAIDVD